MKKSPKRDEACRFVAADFAASRLPWRYEDVSGLYVCSPNRGKRHDGQPSDEGSEPQDDGLSDSTDGNGDDGDGDGLTAVADGVSDDEDSDSSGGAAAAGGPADAGGSSGGLAAAMPSNAIVPFLQELRRLPATTSTIWAR